MNQREFVLASMAAAKGNSYQPVQIQKLLFLLEKRALHKRIFDFQPYAYGPFDPEVYKLLEKLASNGLVEIVGQPFARNRRYRLTAKGEKVATGILNKLPKKDNDYFVLMSEWVRKRSFQQLIGAIYEAYPDMRVNSIFRG
jgi:DNA-binding PadR family transcriptional regulator